MRNFSPELNTHLDGAITTLCHCWKLIRRDGQIFGFTDHDRDLNFGSVTFIARTGLEAADMTQENSLAIGGGEISGALSSASLTQSALLNGLYDDANIEIWLVNWADVNQRALLDIASIGEVKRADYAFVAELRSLTHRLDEERGRVFRPECDAQVGDQRCGAALNTGAYTGSATIANIVSATQFVMSNVSNFSDGWFAGGKISWVTGENAGLISEIKTHHSDNGQVMITLWIQPSLNAKVGDQCLVSAGCDKTFATCRLKFNNTANFRGFPHMPGNDFVVRLPQQGENGMHGGSLYQ